MRDDIKLSLAAWPLIAVLPFQAVAEPEGEGRFVQQPGTGGSKVVRTANPQNQVEESIRIAREKGGVPMDPALQDINLPGLKPDSPTLKPWVLHTRNGVNEVVELSTHFINRIATPFSKPSVIDPSEATIKVIGSDVYYIPSGKQPNGIFIIDLENKGQTISLTVIPKDDIPGQNLMVKLEDLRVASSLVPNSPRGSGDVPKKQSDYVGYIRALMSQAIRGKVDDFSIVPLEGGVAKIGDIEVIPDLVFTGSILDIYRYKLKNAGKKLVDLNEPAFYREGVKAVAFFPALSLEPEEESYVFILADKVLGAQ